MKFGKSMKPTSPSQSTKRALIASAVCTVLCALLLFSASIAWFSATKESKVSEIYSGNLDVAFTYSKNLTDWLDVTDTTDDIFKVNVEGQDAPQDILWEPGAAGVVYFKIENKGTLTAKYDLSVLIDSEIGGKNYVGDDFKLSDYIKGGLIEMNADAVAFTADDDGRAATIAALGDNPKTLAQICAAPLVTDTTAGVPIVGDATEQGKTYALVLYVPNDDETSAAINYKTPTNGMRPKVSLKVSFVATQMVGENDSFGNKYDETAYIVKVPANPTAADLIKAIDDVPNGGTIQLPATTGGSVIKLPGEAADKPVTFKGDGVDNTKIDRWSAQGLSGAVLIVTDATLVGGTADYIGFQHTDNEYYENCKFTGKTFFYGNKVVCKNCVFEQNTYDYCFWTYGAKEIVFENCVFNTVGKAAKVYNEYTSGAFNVSFKNCTFNTTNTSKDKPAIAVNSIGASFKVVCTNCTATDFANGTSVEDTAMTAWYDGRMASAPAAARQLVGCEGDLGKITVTIDGTTY